MPAEFELDYTNHLVRTRAWDLVIAGELHAVASGTRRLFADGTIDAEWSELVDFRGVTRMDFVPLEAVQELARNNPWPKSARRAIVAPAAVVFGVSRMYELLTHAEDGAMTVVRTEAEALEFLCAGRYTKQPPLCDPAE